MRRSAILFILVSLLIITNPGAALAEWEPDGIAVASVYGEQRDVVIVTASEGNVIMVWRDYRSLPGNDIYAQMFDRYGNPQWDPGGIPICVASGDQDLIRAVTDGAGGAIITWADRRASNNDIYAQRIDADGATRWTADGLPICTFFENQGYPDIISDGMGGAIIVWEDNWAAIHCDIYAQRVDGDGSIYWTPQGIPISETTDDQRIPTIAEDGTGGAVITWVDDRNTGYDIYSQRIRLDGSSTWTTNGIAICTASGSQLNPDIIGDQDGGAVIVWEDDRDGNQDIYAQRVDSLGAVQWVTDGVRVHQIGTDSQVDPVMISDGSGGILVAWVDERNGAANEDIYAQRIDADGNWRWIYGGVPICTADDIQWPLQIAPDGAGGAFLAWRDLRSGNMDIYAQRISDDGTGLWTDDGVSVCSYAETQADPAVAFDGLGGAVIAWKDYRNLYHNKLYVQRIEPRYGHWGVPEPVIAFVTDIAPDEGGSVDLSWYGSQLDDYMYGEVTHYSIWRATDPIPLLASPDEIPLLTSPQDVGKDFDGSAIRIEQTAAGDYFWEWIANADALGLSGYSYTASTRIDSTVSDPAIHYFQVVTHTQTPTTYWISEPDSGYSVDNLSPCPPAPVMAEQIYTPEGLEITYVSSVEEALKAVFGGLPAFQPRPS